MNLGVFNKSLSHAHKKRKWIILIGLLGLSSYGAYRVYHSPSMVKKRKRVVKFLGALISIAKLVSDSAETASVVSNDLNDFLWSDSDELPRSLRQLAKIAASKDFNDCVVRVSQGLTVGVLRGYGSESKGEIREPSVADKVIDRLMSPAGTGFVSVVVGSFARNLVLGFYSNVNVRAEEDSSGNMNSSDVVGLMDVVCSDRCKGMMADCIQTLVSTSVAVYLDKTTGVNAYDELFSGLTNPKHQAKVKDILVSVCNGAVETLVKTSHQAMIASKSNSNLISNSACSIVDQNEYATQTSGKAFEQLPLGKVKESNRWLANVSSTLAVPSNRRLVLDVTGRVTFETVRSIAEFFACKLSESYKRSVSVVHDEVTGKGLDIITYISAKSSVILTICLALFLHILGSTQALLPA